MNVEQAGYPLGPLSVPAFWDPESMNHHCGILSVGSGKAWSVLQHRAGAAGDQLMEPTLSKLRYKACVPISLSPSQNAGKGSLKFPPSE